MQNIRRVAVGAIGTFMVLEGGFLLGGIKCIGASLLVMGTLICLFSLGDWFFED